MTVVAAIHLHIRLRRTPHACSPNGNAGNQRRGYRVRWIDMLDARPESHALWRNALKRHAR